VARYLLATQAFVDLARSGNSPVRAWLMRAHQERGTSDIDLAVSVMSLVALEREFQDLQRLSNLNAQKSALRQRCQILAQEFDFRKAILPFANESMTVWPMIQGLDPSIDEEGFVFATAITLRLTLLAGPDPLHTNLRQFGLLVEDPYVP
jgi:hypothetical protein